MWTEFMDMHSGGGIKEPPYQYIFIEAQRGEAIIIFYNKFQHNPHRVTCTCCGNDYSISEYKSLEKATEYERIDMIRHEIYKKTKKYIPYNDKSIKPASMKKFKERKDVLVIYKNLIQEDERRGDVPEQGYIWVD